MPEPELVEHHQGARRPVLAKSLENQGSWCVEIAVDVYERWLLAERLTVRIEPWHQRVLIPTHDELQIRGGNIWRLSAGAKAPLRVAVNPVFTQSLEAVETEQPRFWRQMFDPPPKSSTLPDAKFKVAYGALDERVDRFEELAAITHEACAATPSQRQRMPFPECAVGEPVCQHGRHRPMVPSGDSMVWPVAG